MTSKPPKFVGLDGTSDPIASRYTKEAVRARVAERKANNPVQVAMPDLSAAQAMYDPSKDGPKTLQDIGKAVQTAQGLVGGPQAAPGAAPGPTGAPHTPGTPRGLQPGTIELLSAVKKATDEKTAQPGKETQKMSDQAPAAAPSPPPKTPPKGNEEAVRERINQMDDLEFDRVLRSIQQDAINNEKEREAVKKRVTEFDLGDVLANNAFTQIVPIVPGKLVVHYRSISAVETQALRLMLAKMTEEDPRRENLAAEIFGMMQTACAIVQINGNRLPDHMQNGQFNEDAFRLKYERIISYPLPLMHALGTHAYWFEMRTREAFSTADLKNG